MIIKRTKMYLTAQAYGNIDKRRLARELRKVHKALYILEPDYFPWEPLYFAFIWSDSPQGLEFWRSVANWNCK